MAPGPTSSSSSSPRASSFESARRRDQTLSDGEAHPFMTEILVLVDHVDGDVRKTTADLLTFARRLGDPSAVFIGDNIDAARASLKQYGAEKVYVLDAPELAAAWVAPKSEALAQLVEQQRPAAVL